MILRAKLLVDASAFSEAVRWLGRNRALSGDAERAPVYDFLRAVGYRGMGDIGKEKQNLSKVISLSPDSELGQAAARLLSAK